MHFSRYYMIIALNIFSALAKSQTNKLNRNTSNANEDQTTNSTNINCENQNLVPSSANKNDYLEHIENKCLLCADQSPIIETDSYVVENSSWFKPMIESLKNKSFIAFFEATPFCPVCNSKFKGDSRIYLRNFIKRLFINPNKKMIEIFEKIIFSYYDMDLTIDDIFISNDIQYKTCKDILKWTKDSKLTKVLEFRVILSRKVEEVKNQKISAAKFSKFFKKTETTTDIWMFLHDNFDTIKLLTEFQIRILLESKFKYFSENTNILSEYPELLDEKISESINNISEAFSISITLLHINSDLSFDLFIKLNNLFKQDSKYRKLVLFQKFCNSYKKSVSIYTYALEILKTINLSISDIPERADQIEKDVLLREFFSEKNREYLKNNFSDNFIIDAIKESFILNDDTVLNIMKFYFEDFLDSTNRDSVNEVLERLLNEVGGGPNFKDMLKYLLIQLYKNDLVSFLDNSVLIKIFVECFRYAIKEDILKPFVEYIYNYSFDIAKHLCIDSKIRRLFYFLNKFSILQKYDYDYFDLSSRFFLKNSENLIDLCNILKPEDVYPALEIICLKTKFLNNFSFDDRTMLKNLINVIIRQPQKDKLFEIVADRLPKSFHYLIKLYLIDYSVTLVRERENENRKIIFNELIVKYIKRNIKKTDSLDKVMKNVKNFDLFDYLNPDNLSSEEFNKNISTNLKNIKKSKLIDLCHELYVNRSKVTSFIKLFN